MLSFNFGFWSQWVNTQKCTFDGLNKLILINYGETTIDVKIDLYSDWKEWLLVDDNSKWLEAIRVVGGDPITESMSLGATYFLINGWKIRPWEGDYQLTVTGNLYSDDGLSPFVSTVNPSNVQVRLQTSNLIDAIDVGGGSGASASEVWAYNNRQLTSFTFPVSATNSVIVNEDSIASKVWTQPDRQLTSFAFLSSSNLTEDTIATAVWAKNNRELTAFTLFTPTQIASSVWVSPSRTLTDSVSISTSAISAGVWGDQLSSYGAGTAGQKLSSLASVSSGVIDTSSLLNADLTSSSTPNSLGWILKKIYQLTKYIGYGK